MFYVHSFEEVLDLAEEFKKYAPDTGVVRELEEDQAHLFLERRGETLTVVELRDGRCTSLVRFVFKWKGFC